MQHFCGPTDHIASFDCDNATELATSARACKWRLATATTGMPQTNGAAERSVRTVKEGGGCGVVQSGYNAETFWPEMANASAFNIQPPFNRKHEDNRTHKSGHFKGLLIPFGALVDFMPQPDTKVVSMGSKTIPGVFIGCHVHPGGLWSGDYLVADYSPFTKD